MGGVEVRDKRGIDDSVRKTDSDEDEGGLHDFDYSSGIESG